jgi:hypothetical protein
MMKNYLLDAMNRRGARFTRPVLSLALALVLVSASAVPLFISCENPADSSGNTGDPPLEFGNFTFQAGEPVKGQASAQKDALAGTFAAENGKGTVSYALVAGENSFDNARFTVDGDKLVIAAAALTEEREYKIRARATDGEGKTLESAFTVEVFGIPKKPGGLIVIAGQRRLHLSWNRVGGAENYTIRYNTTNSFAAGSGAVTVPGEFTEEKVIIEGLADATSYWVQARAKNIVGTGDWSSAAASDTPTGDPIDAFWYTGNYQHLLGNVMYPAHKSEYEATSADDRVGWDSMTDCYYFIPENDGVRLIYGAPGVAVPPENSLIFYHKKFPAAEAAAAAAGSMYCKGLSLYMADNSTRPDAGVFIIKHRNPGGSVGEGPREDPTFVYYSTYYWGLGAIQRDKDAFKNPGVDIYGKYLIDRGKSAPNCPVPSMPAKPSSVTFYSPNLAHAKANYTLAHMNYHIAWISVPWYQRTLQYLGKNSSGDGAAMLAGWLPNTSGPVYVMPEEE